MSKWWDKFRSTKRIEEEPERYPHSPVPESPEVRRIRQLEVDVVLLKSKLQKKNQ